MGTFKRRVEYCQRLAARQAAHQSGHHGLGFGWRAVTLARLGPIFDHVHFPPDKHNLELMHFILDTIETL